MWKRGEHHTKDRAEAGVSHDYMPRCGDISRSAQHNPCKKTEEDEDKVSPNKFSAGPSDFPFGHNPVPPKDTKLAGGRATPMVMASKSPHRR